MTRTIITLIMTLATALAHGVEPTWRLTHLDYDDGLANDYVMNVVQDHHGYIWIATEGGLSRFDGSNFALFTTENSGLSSNELNYLLTDPQRDRMWIATQRHGLCFYDYATDSINCIKTGDGILLSNDIPHLSPASDGGMWITSYHIGTQHWNPADNSDRRYTYENVDGMPRQCWATVEDNNGHIYVGHVRDGVSIIDTATRRRTQLRHDPTDPTSLPGDEVRSICIDYTGMVWFGTNAGAACYDPVSQKTARFVNDPDDPGSILPGMVMDIKESNNGDIMMATSRGGVSILSRQSMRFVDGVSIKFKNLTPRDDGTGLHGSYIRTLHQDSWGNIWIGVYRNGIDFISHISDNFRRCPYTESYGNNNRYKPVWSVTRSRDGHLWIGGENEIARADSDGNVKTTIMLPTSRTKPHVFVRAIAEDADGHIWIGTNEAGLMCYDPQLNEFTPPQFNMPADIRCFYLDGDRLWIGTREGLYTLVGDSIQLRLDLTDNLHDPIVQSICTDTRQRMWVGTFGKGVTVFNRDGSVAASHRVESGFPSNAVNAMIRDSKGRIWAATRNGAVMFDAANPETYTHIGAHNGLPVLNVRSIAEGRDGHIWLSTDNNLVRVNAPDSAVSVYTRFNDLRFNSFLDNSSIADASGQLFFGSLNGLYAFDPASLAEQYPLPPVKVTRFMVFDRNRPNIEDARSIPVSTEGIRLTHNQNSFKVSFNVLDYALADRVEYSYNMKGLDNAWYNTGGDTELTFRDLAPGKYTLYIKARIHGNTWNEPPTTLDITVTPPVWLSWWAKLIYAVIAAALVLLIVGFYKRKLNLEQDLLVERRDAQNKQQLNEERLRFYTNITHELRTPLTLILGPLEDMMADNTLSPRHAGKINLIHQSSLRLLKLINDLLEFRKTETQNAHLTVTRGNLANLVREIGLRYKDLNRNEKVQFNIDIADDERPIFFDREKITTILENLLSNASKYTPQGEITLRYSTIVDAGTRYAVIEVADTGHGIAPSALPHIYERYYQASSPYHVAGSGIGLALVKSLTELHQGSIDVTSTVDVGTRFTLRLAADNTYPDAVHDSSPATQPVTVSPTQNDAAYESNERPIALIVEDDAEIREFIKQSLDNEFKVLTAENGKEGLELTRAHIPNIIVSDIMMPIMDGIEMCRRIKGDMTTSHIPVIMLTAKGTMQDREEGYDSGADSYLTKPFSNALLRSRINNLLAARHKLAAAWFDHIRNTMAATASAVPSDEPTQQPSEAQIADNGEEEMQFGSLDREFIDKVNEIIVRHMATDKIDIAFLASKMCMSHSTLYRKIKAVADMHVNEYIRRVKLNQAALLMLKGRHSVSEICFMTGFGSVSYFRQCFKTEFGVSPSDYPKTINKK